MWYHRRANDLDLFLVSDAEGNFDWNFDTRYTFVTTRNIRASDLLMKRVSALEYESLVPHADNLIVLHIDTEIPQPGAVGALSLSAM
jgi:hypothetical protein